MIRHVPIELDGVEYPLVFSTRVMMRIEEKGYTLSAYMAELAKGKTSFAYELLEWMLDAGYRYFKLREEESATPPSFDDLIDSTTVEDLENLFGVLAQAVTAGTDRKVEVAEDKKQKKRTTQVK